MKQEQGGEEWQVWLADYPAGKQLQRWVGFGKLHGEVQVGDFAAGQGKGHEGELAEGQAEAQVMELVAELGEVEVG